MENLLLTRIPNLGNFPLPCGRNYRYDTLNRLHTLTYNNQTPNFVFGHDALSRRNSLTRPNSVDTSYAYDPVSRLTSVLHKLGTTVLDGATYTYDGAGNRLTRTDKRIGTTLAYGYDNIYQLKTAKQVSFFRPWDKCQAEAASIKREDCSHPPATTLRVSISGSFFSFGV